MRVVSLVLLGVQLAACPPGLREVGSVDAGVVVDAGLEVVGAPPVEVVVDGPDGAVSLVFSGGEAELDPTAALSVRSPVALTGCRVRLLDSADRVLPSDDVSEVSDAGLRYQVRLVEPLSAGRRYSLVIDAEGGPQLSDVTGRRYEDLRRVLQVRTAGAPGAPTPPGRARPARR